LPVIEATLTTFLYHRNGKEEKGPGLLEEQTGKRRKEEKKKSTMSGEDQIVPALLCTILHSC